ncbi:MoaD/ThiS family protein [Legionella jamestowniensis]|uniref:ThiS family protein n=1 Tax=Legionella jamestowniensis TaxID=455 RepID=A0A0W0UKN9_9GAMM|nr:MoaD/ThiS family protein [Legionella jamestowniensis]KTD08189.1 ThiS family protein [Legionella jamestowniensis]OCH98512.1 hypothetical protein A8135_00270 [Legionella jamestowniensis]SFL98706.1 Molybdopterin converting factor, small subunit [Legionella jamestowniensis DSM 19215]
MMIINVHLHGPWRDYSEQAVMAIEMDDGAQISTLRKRLLAEVQKQHSAFNPELMSVSAFAVDESLVTEQFILSNGMSVHILPPVNGG